MSKHCTHIRSIAHVTPSAPNRHATRHFHATQHPIIEGYEPPEGSGWCFVDKVMVDFADDTTPQREPIPRYD